MTSTTAKKAISIALIIAGVVALASVPTVTESDSTINLLILIFLHTMLASSWNILGGYTGQVNLGHAAFFGLGTLLTRLLYTHGFPLFPSLLAGGVLAVVFAMVIGIPAFRLRLRGDYFAIGTLALAQILYVTVGNVLPKISSLPTEYIATYQLAPRYYVALALALFTIGVACLVVNSRIGLGMMAVREGEDAAESLGVNALKHKLFALGVSAFLGGLAGGAFAYYHVSYYYNFPFTPPWSLDPVTMAFVGGVGTIIGPIVGAVFFVVLREYLVLNVGEYHLLVFGVLFILVVLFLPEGLVGAWERVRQMHTRRSRREKAMPSPQEEG